MTRPVSHVVIHLMGCRIDNLTMEETVEAVGRLIATGGPHQHVVVNVDKLVQARRSPALRGIINSCSLVNADGMPVVWATRLLGCPLKERVAGIDLFEALLARAARTGWRVYLLGAREEVVREVARRSRQRYPGLVIAGWRNGYWQAREEPAVAEAIREARPDILFVALGSPAKETFLARWQARMQVPFAMGVGGSFDVAAGRVRRAPRWMQRAGLEWFFRFLQEPRRMFRRYFIDSAGFFAMLAKALWIRQMRRILCVLAGGCALLLALAGEG